jgi:acyl-CoA thioesterase
MDAAAFLGLEPTEEPLRFRLPVAPEISTGGGFLFGGAALGACISALEQATGRPAVWATGQYLSFARPPETMGLQVVIAADGKQSTQARAVGLVGEREILTVNAALGSRSFPDAGRWTAPVSVPAPDDCPPRPSPFPVERTIAARLDQRLVPDEALGGPATKTGRTVLWSRMPELLEMSAAALAVLGDYVPLGIGRALDRLGQITSNSLDNTLRIVQVVPTQWVLLDIHVDAVHDGVGHGTVHLWAEDGTLLAIASQSAKIRLR